jgi:hypothetical protein
MSPGKLVAQTTRKAPSSPLRETFIAPTLLHVCCMCGHIREETGTSHHREHWVTERRYQKTHGVNPAEFPLTHTYCLKCFTKVQNTARQYARKIGRSS